MEVTPKILVANESTDESSTTSKILVTNDSVNESTITPIILVTTNPGDYAKISNINEYILVDTVQEIKIDINYNTSLSSKQSFSSAYNTNEERNYLIDENYNIQLATSINNINILFATSINNNIEYSNQSNTSLNYVINTSDNYSTNLYENQIISIDSKTNISKEIKSSENYNTDIELQKSYKVDQNNNTKVVLYSNINNISDIDFDIVNSINENYSTSSKYQSNESINYNTEYERYNNINDSYNISENRIQDLSIDYNTELDTTIITYPINDNYNIKLGRRKILNKEYNTFVMLNIKEEDDGDMSADVLVNLYVDSQRIVDTCKNLIDKTGITIATQARNNKDYNVIDMTNASHTGILIKNDLDITNEAFTIGYWAKSADTENVSNICVDIESTDLAVKMQVENSEVLKGTTYSAGYEITDDNILRLNLALLDQAWHYITYCRVKNNYTATTENDSDSLLVFIDGKKILTVPMNTDENFDNKKFTIGYNADADKRFIGYIDDYILVKNIALHEVDFTTTPDTYMTKTVSDTILNTTTKSFKSVGTNASDVTVNQHNDSDTIDILSLHNKFNIVNN